MIVYCFPIYDRFSAPLSFFFCFFFKSKKQIFCSRLQRKKYFLKISLVCCCEGQRISKIRKQKLHHQALCEFSMAGSMAFVLKQQMGQPMANH